MNLPLQSKALVNSARVAKAGDRAANPAPPPTKGEGTVVDEARFWRFLGSGTGLTPFSSGVIFGNAEDKT